MVSCPIPGVQGEFGLEGTKLFVFAIAFSEGQNLTGRFFLDSSMYTASNHSFSTILITFRISIGADGLPRKMASRDL